MERLTSTSTWEQQKPSIEIFHQPRLKGGRCFIDVKILHNKQIKQLSDFLYKKSEHSTMQDIITLIDRSTFQLTKRTFIPKIETKYKIER